MTNDAKQKQAWEVKRDGLASMYEYPEHSSLYDIDYQGFIDGYNACRAEMQAEIDELKSCKAKMAGAMPIELVDRSRQILKEEYEAELIKRDIVIEKMKSALESVAYTPPEFDASVEAEIADEALAECEKIMGEELPLGSD